eukprot:scaffold1661_cov251-Pinguiococcus_pyrenoidosus.AAC.54
MRMDIEVATATNGPRGCFKRRRFADEEAFGKKRRTIEEGEGEAAVFESARFHLGCVKHGNPPTSESMNSVVCGCRTWNSPCGAVASV